MVESVETVECRQNAGEFVGRQSNQRAETMASSFCCSTRFVRRVLCALFDPKSTPVAALSDTATVPTVTPMRMKTTAIFRQRNRCTGDSLDCNAIAGYACFEQGGVTMASITIRNLDDDVKSRLRVRAAGNGRSMEEEVRLILLGAVRRTPSSDNLANIIRAYFGPSNGVDLELPPRDAGREPPSFD